MKIEDVMSVIARQRSGEGSRARRAPRLKPGREIRDGVLCYDGTGPSGYRGRCDQAPLTSTVVFPIEVDEPFLAGRNSRRLRQHIWLRPEPPKPKRKRKPAAKKKKAAKH